MLIIEPLAQGQGIFTDVFKRIPGWLAKASKAVNSSTGKKVLGTIQKAAKSDIGKAVIEEVKNKALEAVPETVKGAVQTELGQHLIKEGAEQVKTLKRAFDKLGVPEKKRRSSKKRKKKGGSVLTDIIRRPIWLPPPIFHSSYPNSLTTQFGSGIVLEK